MTLSPDPSTVEQALHNACEALNLDPTDATCIHRHATAIYLLPREGVVARIARGPEQRDQAQRAVHMTRWLMKYDFPVTEPLDVVQPVEAIGHPVTFWVYYPQPTHDPPTPADLGGLLRELHHLPPAPVDLPTYQPLVGLSDAVQASSSLSSPSKAWLLDRSSELLDRYSQLDFALPAGHIHGDAYPGNLLRDGQRVVLGDWDETAVGPRELDLVNTFQGVRYGRTPEELRRFSDAYGHNVDSWSGFSTLRTIRDLHTLGAFIRRADRGDAAAARELKHRIATLQRGSNERWAVIR